MKTGFLVFDFARSVSYENLSLNKQVLEAILYCLTLMDSKKSTASG